MHVARHVALKFSKANPKPWENWNRIDWQLNLISRQTLDSHVRFTSVAISEYASLIKQAFAAWILAHGL
jgi:hypothetical protein